jgi:hypothetical protein
MMLIISSCTPQNPSTNRIGSSSESTSGGSSDGGNSTSDTPTEIPETPTTWFADGITVSGTLTQNATDTASFYLRGSSIQNYIINNNKQSSIFCLVTSISSTTPATKKQQIRFRALPITLLGTSEVVLRIDTASSSDNGSFCGGDGIPSLLSNGTITANVNASDAAYTFSTVCPTCSSTFTSTRVNLYESISGSISASTQVSETSVNLSGLNIKIDNTNNSNQPTNNCSESQCQAQGFDCCLDGQCVKDGILRSNPDPALFPSAVIDVAKDPLNFKNWPTVYYVCSENTGNPPSSGDDNTTDPVDQAQQQLEKDIKDFNCLEEFKATQTEVQCDPNHQTVQLNTWKKCGCLLDLTTNTPIDPRCPDYGLKAIRDNSNNIVKIECDVPPPATDPKPFQNLDINISAKTAPHRFYSLSGSVFDDLSTVPAGTNQEGTEFSYLDNVNKVAPVTTSFEMNSILGQMSLALDQALPATAIDIDLDQSYIISATSAFYTPCDSCQKDPWFVAFSNAPEVFHGNGLGWQNYSTSRSEFGDNQTNGNYEDTIFGRACWVPPTMIPFTHTPNANVGIQRRNRLAAQAALYINGYQRDWYGFNKGALIGSFDGVKWFAVGAGRRVRSTSKKLFLAINAPFADLAQPTNYSVTVVQDLGGQSAADFDYDFNKGLTDSGQNAGASCQYMHQCNVDSDCVGKLGWEYSCADVNDLKTNWPVFDINANERANSEKNAVSFNDVLFAGLNGSNTRRCVYRGAGAPCKLDYNANIAKENTRKLLTCAPNFYCASLDSGNFSDELKREPNQPSTILYGQGSNTLGRPLEYVGGTKNLTTDIRSNLLANMQGYDATGNTGTFGVCRPGKQISVSTHLNQHQNADTSRRADYISQQGSCDSTATGDARITSCSNIGPDGNFDNTFSASTTEERHRQNMCSGESKTGTTSTFASIESPTLVGSVSITTPTLAANACFRRAGATCQTNLDCAPNNLHAEVAGTLDRNDFGGTLAELNFWKEELICGQPQTKPTLGTSNITDYLNYDLGQNRCCREVSKDFTMYTSIAGATKTQISGYETENDSLNTKQYGYLDPAAAGRYSRYAIADKTLPTTDNPTTTSLPKVEVNSDSDVPNNQWKTISQTGELTCCGGGFIRKFDDGTNDWSNRNRLRLSPENFACLNYSTKLYKEENTGSLKGNWSLDYSNLCLYPGTTVDGSSALLGCIQQSIQDEFQPTPLVSPVAFPGIGATGTLTTFPGSDFDGSGTIDPQIMIRNHVFHPPTLYQEGAFDNNLLIFRDFDNFAGNVTDKDSVIAFYLPPYITNVASILGAGSVVAQRRGEGHNTQVTLNHTLVTEAQCTFANLIVNGDNWCIGLDGTRRFFAARIAGDGNPGNDWSYGWLEMDFQTSYDANATTPGSDQFYEDRLARLELLGVPQMTYEPIACNDDSTQLVPGIFTPTTTANFATLDTPGGKVHYKEDGSTVALGKVFSANDFKCCSKLGSTVTNATKCCSGFASSGDGDSGLTCKLPSGTNLNLYLNKFISSESNVSDNTELSMSEDDFDAETGYPKYSETAYAKVRAIGQAYCANGTVKTGGAFGNFFPQPNNGSFIGDGAESYYSIVDSIFDFDSNTNAGYGEFMAGFRWKLHQYCE